MTTRAERIEQAINGSGNTPSGIAKLLKISPQAVSQWLSGDTKNIKNDLLFALEDVTGYSARWIATGEGRMLVLPTDAVKLAEVYEQLDGRGKETIKRIADVESAQSAGTINDPRNHSRLRRRGQ